MTKIGPVLVLRYLHTNLRWLWVSDNLETGSQLAELLGVGEINAFSPGLLCSNHAEQKKLYKVIST